MCVMSVSVRQRVLADFRGSEGTYAHDREFGLGVTCNTNGTTSSSSECFFKKVDLLKYSCLGNQPNNQIFFKL